MRYARYFVLGLRDRMDGESSGCMSLGPVDLCSECAGMIRTRLIEAAQVVLRGEGLEVYD